MIPCKLCSPDADKGVPPLDAEGKLLRGLKQVTKTKRSDVTWSNKYGEITAPGAHGERLYRCQDCGALWRFQFDTTTKESRMDPVLVSLPGGKGG